jgi:4-hydroxybenzoate polyprenyltransferase
MAERTRRYGTKTAAWSGIVVVLLALVPAVLRVADGRAGWPEALFILAGAGFITFHATRLVLLRRTGGKEDDGGPH